ncbi:DNA-directed RNA polymerase III subunit RPC3 [Smittium culicis]|uniref:DNA-directed RNA polymerase III subunit RPC3 n=1 Tax=Smittium culicis TaxID=133412 RepID=A0A1R1X553_9FUNG|nr:DNA-directed RNA polymerase III subunit RPC3 [Smittium culicis]
MFLHKRGRATSAFIASETKLSKRNVIESLAILIQHSVVTFFENIENGSQKVFYSLNKKNLLRRPRIGLYLAKIEEKFGKIGLEIANIILTNGILSQEKLVEILRATKAEKVIGYYKDSMFNMVNDRVLVMANQEYFQTTSELKLKMEDNEIKTLAVPPTAKELDEIRSRINEEIYLKQNSRVISGTKRKEYPNGYSENEYKRYRAYDDESGGDVELDPKSWFVFSFDRLDVYMRNTQLVMFTESITNVGGGSVIKAMLELSDNAIKSCREAKTFTLTTSQIVQKVPVEQEIHKHIILGNDQDNMNMYYAKAESTQVSMHVVGESIYSFLELITNNKARFLIKTDGIGPGQYYIDFKKAISAIKNKHLQDFVRSNLGNDCVRLLNILGEHDFLDEKQLCKLALTNPRDPPVGGQGTVADGLPLHDQRAAAASGAAETCVPDSSVHLQPD